jgi:nucleotide-binding universal stress UspA family protein
MFVHRAAIEERAVGHLPSLSRVLLITDFSSCSEAAVPVARLMAETYGGSVTAAHVIFRDQDLGANEAVIGTPEEIAGIAERQMAGFMTRNSLAQAESIIAGGPFEEAIATLITEKQFDAVVVGTRGRSGVGKLLLGSVAQRVFNSAPCPVITVSRKARGGMGSTLNKILYATDLSDISKRALPYALSVAKANNADLLLACAPDDSARGEGMEQEFAEWTAFASAAWHRVSQFSLTGDPASGIVGLAASNSVDLIVIGAERLSAGPLYRFNVPMSTAYRIVANAPCPVLRVRS